jgi:hypothetical protein
MKGFSVKTHDDQIALLAGHSKGEKRGVFDLEKLDHLLRRFADVEEFLGRKLVQLSRHQC